MCPPIPEMVCPACSRLTRLCGRRCCAHGKADRFALAFALRVVSGLRRGTRARAGEAAVALARAGARERLQAGCCHVPVSDPPSRCPAGSPLAAHGGPVMNTQPLVLVADDEPRITRLVAMSPAGAGLHVMRPLGG